MRHRLMIAVVASILSLGAFPGTASSEVTFRTVLTSRFHILRPLRK